MSQGLYFTNLQEWLKVFPLEQILFINGHTLAQEPDKSMDKLQDFLKVRHLIRKEHFFFNNKTGFFCLKNPDLNSGDIKCMDDSKGREHPVINSTVLNLLRDYYREDSQKLFILLKEQKPWWPL